MKVITDRELLYGIHNLHFTKYCMKLCEYLQYHSIDNKQEGFYTQIPKLAKSSIFANDITQKHHEIKDENIAVSVQEQFLPPPKVFTKHDQILCPNDGIISNNNNIIELEYLEEIVALESTREQYINTIDTNVPYRVTLLSKGIWREGKVIHTTSKDRFVGQVQEVCALKGPQRRYKRSKDNSIYYKSNDNIQTIIAKVPILCEIDLTDSIIYDTSIDTNQVPGTILTCFVGYRWDTAINNSNTTTITEQYSILKNTTLNNESFVIQRMIDEISADTILYNKTLPVLYIKEYCNYDIGYPSIYFPPGWVYYDTTTIAKDPDEELISITSQYPSTRSNYTYICDICGIESSIASLASVVLPTRFVISIDSEWVSCILDPFFVLYWLKVGGTL